MMVTRLNAAGLCSETCLRQHPCEPPPGGKLSGVKFGFGREAVSSVPGGKLSGLEFGSGREAVSSVPGGQLLGVEWGPRGAVG